MIVNKKKQNSCIVDFAVPADHRLKLKERERRDKYLDLARELKQLYNMKMMVITIVIAAPSSVTKGYAQELEELELRGHVDTIQTASFLRLVRLLRRVLEN